MCLNKATLTDSCCWDPNDSDIATNFPCADSWATAQGDSFCTDTTMNRWLIDVLNPADSTKCPQNTDTNILVVSETGDAGVKYLTGSKDGWKLNGKMPAADADAWNCKALILADNTFKTGLSEAGYLYFTAEQFGFGDWVKVIVQPPTLYQDYNFRSETEDPSKMSKVFRSVRTNRFIIPDAYDVLIEFEPKKGDPGYNDQQQAATEQGTFRLKV